MRWVWGHALAVSAYASELVQNRTRPLTPHLCITHEQRTYHVHSTDIRKACTCVDALSQWFMHWACVKCSWNTRPYLLVCVDMRDMPVIVNHTCAVHAWFVSDFCPRHPNNLVNFSMHKPNLCVLCEWFVRDRLCDWPLSLWAQAINVQHYVSFC